MILAVRAVVALRALCAVVPVRALVALRALSTVADDDVAARRGDRPAAEVTGGEAGRRGQLWTPRVWPGAVLVQIDVVHRLDDVYPDTFELARTADDVVRIHRSGKIASIVGEMVKSPEMMKRRLREGVEFFQFLRHREMVG